MRFPRDNDPDRDARAAPPSVDEQLVRDWAGVGIARLERMLALRAAFDDYLERRGAEVDGREGR